MAYFRQQEASAAQPVNDVMPMLAPAEILIPTADSSGSVRALPVVLVGMLGLFLIAGTVLATLMIMGRGDDSKTAEQPAADVDTPSSVASANPAVAPQPVVISDADDGDSEMVFDPEPAVEKRASDDDDEARAARHARREARREAKNADEAQGADERSREDVLAELRAKKAAREAASPAPVVVAQPAVTPERVEPARPKCDEVACLVNPSDPCCDTLSGKKKQAKAEQAAASELPEKLTSSEVNSGISKIRGRVGACGTKHGFQGVATFKLTIADDGTLTSAKVDKGSDEFKSCVTEKLDTATFKQTQKGLTVAYPFVFR